MRAPKGWTRRGRIDYLRSMDLRTTALPGVLVLTPRRYGDDRGYFSEVWSSAALRKAGLDLDFVQDNESRSARAGTVRGLHYQAPPFAQTKLVRVCHGAVLDIAVDVRAGSPTYGQWVAEELSAANGAQLLVPRGFLHGFVTLQPDTIVAYKVDNPYDTASDGAVFWNDATLGINWGIGPGEATVSDKDRAAPSFGDWVSPFTYGETA